MKNRKIVKNIRKFIFGMTILLIIVSISFGLTYSNFIFKSDNHKAIEMHFSKLNYDIYINNIKTNTLSISSGNSVINLSVKSNNEVSTFYKLLYFDNPSIEVYYIDNVTFGSINYNEIKSYKLFVNNNSSSSINIDFDVSGGYSNNSLSDVIIEENYKEILNQIKVGDYINYIPNGVYDLTSYEISSIDSGYKDNQNVYLEKTNYRILNINDNGTIDIISENDIYIDAEHNGLFLSSNNGYSNGNIILDDICNKLYGKSIYSIGARNLNINDIANHLYSYISYNNMDTSKDNFTTQVYYDLLMDNKNNWLSSNYFYNDNYGLYSINSNTINHSDLYNNNESYEYSNFLRPVITLSNNINLYYEDMIWNIK